MIVQSDAQIGCIFCPCLCLNNTATLTRFTLTASSDIKRARALLDSVIKTNPKHAPGWIAAAALEVHAKKMVAARKIIAKGCEMCPKSEDVWLQAAELNVRTSARLVDFRGCRADPR